MITNVLSDGKNLFQNQAQVQSNLAILHVFYEKDHLVRYERQELYSLTDFFSNIGGVFGLCLGLSNVSFVELIYFFTLRYLFNKIMNRRENI